MENPPARIRRSPPLRPASCQRSDDRGKLCQKYRPSTYHLLPSHPPFTTRAIEPALIHLHERACLGSRGCIGEISAFGGDGGNICAVLTARQWASIRHAIHNTLLRFSIIHDPPLNPPTSCYGIHYPSRRIQPSRRKTEGVKGQKQRERERKTGGGLMRDGNPEL